MGYRVDTTATLVLEDMAGAEVTVLIGVPIRAVMEFDTADDLASEWAVFLRWAKPVWNLEDADGPIPPEDMDRLPVPVIRAVIRGWRQATVQPPPPLPPTSSAGVP